MLGFIKSFLPIFKRLKKFRVELFILSIAVITAFIALGLYIHGQNIDEDGEIITDNVLSASTGRIIIDVAGAVERPGVYEATSGARLKDILVLAGGLSADAERRYISRNFNLAKLVTDQEKIYIPSHFEISTGIFAEPQRFLDYSSPVEGQTTSVINTNSQKISINSATLEELDTLPGIGKVTAEKIIQNRPYKSVEELLTRKIVKRNVYENIKNLISN
jgi:competence protein ComEA